MQIRTEVMSPVMTKYHVGGLGFPLVFHHFTGPDEGDPHDHPFAFRSIILRGGYVETIYDQDNGINGPVERLPGDSFRVPATRVHKIVRLLEADCWTVILPEPWERKSGFWQFRSDGPYFRTWDNPDWTRI